MATIENKKGEPSTNGMTPEQVAKLGGCEGLGSTTDAACLDSCPDSQRPNNCTAALTSPTVEGVPANGC